MQSLSGIKVLDLTRALAGPFCTLILADLGAEVIKVEPTPKGEMAREWGPFDDATSVYYLSCNRNKKSLAVNFRSEEGLALLRQLILKSDVVIQNFKPGTMANMGLSYESLSKENPGLIMASISGFGNKGPAANWPGFDQIAQGYSGFMSISGTEQTGPTRVGVPIGDLTAGMWLATATLSAIIERGRTGKGQEVDTSLLGSLLALLSVQGQRYLSLEEVPVPTGNDHPVIAPYGAFETADGPLNIASATQGMFERLCKVLEMPELIEDERFLTNKDRVANKPALKALLEQGLSKRTRSEWTPILIDNGIPAGPINRLDDVFSDAQVLANDFLTKVVHPEVGELTQITTPISGSSGSAGSDSLPPPLLGQHSRNVLQDYGWADEKIDTLLQEGIVQQADV